MATKTGMNRKQRRNQRRSLKLRGDGSERSTKQAPPATRRTKRMLVPSMTSPMVAHAEQAAEPKGLLAGMVTKVNALLPCGHMKGDAPQCNQCLLDAAQTAEQECTCAGEQKEECPQHGWFYRPAAVEQLGFSGAPTGVAYSEQPCSKCGQREEVFGEYPCSECGRPTLHNDQTPCASLYGGCAPECGAGNRCQAEPGTGDCSGPAVGAA